MSGRASREHDRLPGPPRRPPRRLGIKAGHAVRLRQPRRAEPGPGPGRAGPACSAADEGRGSWRGGAARDGPPGVADITVESAITEITGDSLQVSAALEATRLAVSRTFEEVAELLWTGGVSRRGRESGRETLGGRGPAALAAGRAAQAALPARRDAAPGSAPGHRPGHGGDRPPPAPARPSGRDSPPGVTSSPGMVELPGSSSPGGRPPGGPPGTGGYPPPRSPRPPGRGGTGRVRVAGRLVVEALCRKMGPEMGPEMGPGNGQGPPGAGG